MDRLKKETTIPHLTNGFCRFFSQAQMENHSYIFGIFHLSFLARGCNWTCKGSISRPWSPPWPGGLARQVRTGFESLATAVHFRVLVEHARGVPRRDDYSRRDMDRGYPRRRSGRDRLEILAKFGTPKRCMWLVSPRFWEWTSGLVWSGMWMTELSCG